MYMLILFQHKQIEIKAKSKYYLPLRLLYPLSDQTNYWIKELSVFI